MSPAASAATKIDANGIHVPSTLRNMSRLRSMTSATTKKSRNTMRARMEAAVTSGLVSRKRDE